MSELLANWSARTELLIGNEKYEFLKNANVLIMGLGGVGSFAAEFIARAGVGKMTIVDGDTVDASNMNRQLPALISNIGKQKAEVVSARLNDINPELNLTIISNFITEEEMENLVTSGNFDYVVDAIDTLAPKLNLIETCVRKKIPIISSMGAGGKFDPSQVKIVDISKSYNCTLARKIRKALHKKKIYKGFKVVFSPEEVSKDCVMLVNQQNKKSTVGTISYMPALFGVNCASFVIRGLLAKFDKKKKEEFQNDSNKVNEITAGLEIEAV